MSRKSIELAKCMETSRYGQQLRCTGDFIELTEITSVCEGLGVRQPVKYQHRRGVSGTGNSMRVSNVCATEHINIRAKLLEMMELSVVACAS